MKKLSIFSTLLLFATMSMAQVNVQMHYDMGRKVNSGHEAERQNFTATLEQFRPDRLGNIFYFIDLDFYSEGMKGAYIEFSREFKFGETGFAVHGEYDGGLTTGHRSVYGSQFQHAFLIGPAYNWASSDFKKTWSIQALFKQYFHGNGSMAYPGVQFTGVWGLTFGQEDMFTFSGFIDFWRNHKGNHEFNVTMLTEPQFWFNLNSVTKKTTNLSIGTEWEMSNNFVFPSGSKAYKLNGDPDRTFFFNPTIALKWTMK